MVIRRKEELRVLRKDQLPHKLAVLLAEEARLKKEAADILKARKEATAQIKALVGEAENPIVEMDFSPAARDFNVYDAANVSDGSLTHDGKQVRDPRQRNLPNMGLEDDGDGEPDENPDSDDVLPSDGDGDGDAPAGMDPSAVEWPEDRQVSPAVLREDMTECPAGLEQWGYQPAIAAWFRDRHAGDGDHMAAAVSWVSEIGLQVDDNEGADLRRVATKEDFDVVPHVGGSWPISEDDYGYVLRDPESGSVWVYLSLKPDGLDVSAYRGDA